MNSDATERQTALELIWYQALSEPMGLLLQVEDPHRAKQLLYRARASTGDPELQKVQLRTSPVEGGNLILIRETVEISRTLEKPVVEVDLTLSKDLSEL